MEKNGKHEAWKEKKHAKRKERLEKGKAVAENEMGRDLSSSTDRPEKGKVLVPKVDTLE